jgi:two-component system, cell cycle response regulator
MGATRSVDDAWIVRQSAASARALFATGAGVCWILFYAAWILFTPGGADALRVFADTAYLVPLASAALLAFVAWRRAPAELRSFWWFMATASAAWLAADTLWCARDLVRGSVPYPWWSDTGYLISYVLLGCAVYAAFRPRFRTVGIARLLDGALVVGCLAAVWWWLLIRPVTVTPELTSAFDLAYPILGLLVIGMLVVVRVLPSRQGTVAMRLVAAGVTCGVLANALYVYISETTGYLTGDWIELAWEAQGVLFSLAALLAAGGIGRPPDWMTFRERQRLTPLTLAGAVAATSALLLVLDASSSGLSLSVIAVLAGLAFLLAARVAVGLRRATAPPADPKTGTYDAGYFGEQLRHLTVRGRHFGESFALALFAVDGAERPAAVAELTASARDVDIVTGLAAGCYAVLLPRVEESEALALADDLREATAALDATLSAGVAAWTPGVDSHQLVAQAERALATAQALGGNRVSLVDEPLDEWQALAELAELVERREGLPTGHSTLIASLAADLALEVGLDGAEVRRAHAGGLFHDIGKVALPAALLRKPRSLDEREWAAIRKHPERGAAILERFESTRPVAAIVAAHHEAWDGSGYPLGLAGDQIPRAARIVGVANALVSMTADRPYRLALSETTALTSLWQQSGRTYDPDVVRALLKLSADGRLPALQAQVGARSRFVSRAAAF